MPRGDVTPLAWPVVGHWDQPVDEWRLSTHDTGGYWMAIPEIPAPE
jgi:hypothetical protein